MSREQDHFGQERGGNRGSTIITRRRILFGGAGVVAGGIAALMLPESLRARPLQRMQIPREYTPRTRREFLPIYEDTFQIDREIVAVVWDTTVAMATHKSFESPIPPPYLLAVMKAETRMIPYLSLETPPKDNINKDGKRDRGWWQINDMWDEEIPRKDRYNIHRSSEWAIDLLYRRSLTTWRDRDISDKPLDTRMWYAYLAYNGREQYANNTHKLAHNGAAILPELDKSW